MSQKTCLVTGANAGLGKEIALALAKTGAHVIMVCRHPERGKLALKDIQTQSGSTAIDLLIADLSSQADIRTLAETIHQRYAKLDVLINNAGAVFYQKNVSVDGIEMTLATNHLAPFLLTHLLLDLLKSSSPARIINISSAIHKWGKIDLTDLQFERRKYHVMKTYAQSKLLLNSVSFELARKLEGTGVTVNCVHPGAVKTHLGSDQAHNLGLKLMDYLIKFFFISPQEAAKTPVYLATAPEMANVSGKYFVKGKAVSASYSSYDPVLAKEIWAASEKLIGESFKT